MGKGAGNYGGLSAVCSSIEESLRSNRRKRGNFRNFVVENGLLHRRTLGKRGIRLRLCVPKELREEIMEACDSDKWSAHLGITRTQHRLKERYYWPWMAQNIRSYVLLCRSCQTRKTLPGKPWGLMESTITTSSNIPFGYLSVHSQVLLFVSSFSKRTYFSHLTGW